MKCRKRISCNFDLRSSALSLPWCNSVPARRYQPSQNLPRALWCFLLAEGNQPSLFNFRMLSYAGDDVDDFQLNQWQPAHSSVDVYMDTAYDHSHYATLFAIAHAHTRRRQGPCESLSMSHLFLPSQAAQWNTFLGAVHHASSSPDLDIQYLCGGGGAWNGAEDTDATQCSDLCCGCCVIRSMCVVHPRPNSHE